MVMATPLNKIVVSPSASLDLNADVLGAEAFSFFVHAFKVTTTPVTLTVKEVVQQDANQLIITGSLPILPGNSAANASVRLYLFEVAAPTSFEYSDRHCLVLIENLPSGYTVANFWAAFGTNQVTELLNQSSFAYNQLLFSSLDYTENSYDTPPFPPIQDRLSSEQQAFLAAIQQDVTTGFTYQLSTALQQDASTPSGETVQGVLSLPQFSTNFFSSLIFTAQAKLLAEGVQLILRVAAESSRLSGNGIPFPLTFAEFGLAFPLQPTGALTLPIVLLRGQISFGTTSPTTCQLAAAFDLSTKYLTIEVTHFPSFGQIEDSLSSSFNLGGAIAGFLPIEGNDLSALGSISLSELALGLDMSQLSLDYLKINFVAGAPFSLVDIVKVTPALEVQVYNPLQPFRDYDINVYGQWQLGKAEIDTILTLDNGTFTLSANLVTGNLNLSDLIEEVLLGQVKALPEVTLSTFSFYAESSQDSKYYQVEAEIESSWNIGDLHLSLDNLSLYANFLNGKLNAAAVKGILDIANTSFNIGAEYDIEAQGWTFSGGTDASINLGDLLTSLAQDLGVDSHGGFLDDFTHINIDGFYLTYTTSNTKSPSLDLFIGLNEAGGFDGGKIPLDTVFIRFHTEGGGIHWRFDGTANQAQTDWTNHLSSYIQAKTNLSVALPSSIAELELKGLSGYYDSSSKNYGFTIYLDFGASAVLHIQVDLLYQINKGYEKDVSGQLVLYPGDVQNQLIFDVELKAEASANEFIASYRAASSKGFNLLTLLQAIDHSANFGNSFQLNVRNALFTHTKLNNITKSLFAIDMDAGINLSGLGELPLIGQELEAAESLNLALQITYAMGGDFTQLELQQLNQSFNLSSFRFPETAIPSGSPNISTSLRLGNETAIDMGLPLQVSSNNDGSLSDNPSQSFTPSGSPQTTQNDGIKWFTLKRAFGPLKLERIGLAYKSGELVTYLDGTLSMLGLTVSVLNLNMAVTLTGSNKFEPHFGLDGLGLDVQKDSLEIGGGLLKISTNNITEFDGFVTLRTEELGLGALGSFAEMSDGAKSLFIYAVLNYPLGGPAFFFVTGLAAGFGYNRRFLIPPINQVQQFPLIAEALNPSPAPPPTDLSQVKGYISSKLALMEQYIPPVVGEYFLTLGIHFTSFDLLDSFVLVTVQFGEHFEVDMLGLSTALLPPNITTSPLVEAQLAIKAAFNPDEGIVLVQGQLTPASFILSRNCHLTGGFAFAFWFGDTHTGDFVVTIGGYHPDFKPPSYYPQVPRVGFNWAVSENLTVKGGGYFALVPHAFMAGGSFSAVWQSGDVKAWFILGSDFLISWKPFHYDAEVYVDLGAEVTIHFFGTHHISIDASADLHVWGPEFGGHARVTVKVIGIHFHFSIDFGASSAPPQKISWQEFQDSFLPANDQRLSASVSGGLIRTVQDDKYGEVWVVKREQLSISTHSYFPVKSVQFTLESEPVPYDLGEFAVAGIAPMDVAAIAESAHTISITRLTTNVPDKDNLLSNLTLNKLWKDYPDALWGHQMERALNPPPEQKLVRTLSGFEIVPSQVSNEDPHPLTASRQVLAYDPYTQIGYTWVNSSGKFTPDSSKDWQDIVNQIVATQSDRSQLLQVMGFEPSQLNYSQPLNRDTFFVPQYGTLES
jgi:hypothetical protein